MVNDPPEDRQLAYCSARCARWAECASRDIPVLEMSLRRLPAREAISIR
jgi:hypothetical protein